MPIDLKLYDTVNTEQKHTIISQYLFQLIIVTLLGIFLTYMQGRVSEDSVNKDVSRIEASISKNSNNIDKLTDNITELTRSISQMVGYVDAQKAQK